MRNSIMQNNKSIHALCHSILCGHKDFQCIDPRTHADLIAVILCLFQVFSVLSHKHIIPLQAASRHYGSSGGLFLSPENLITQTDKGDNEEQQLEQV